jgi:hypothetical protein
MLGGVAALGSPKVVASGKGSPSHAALGSPMAGSGPPRPSLTPTQARFVVTALSPWYLACPETARVITGALALLAHEGRSLAVARLPSSAAVQVVTSGSL